MLADDETLAVGELSTGEELLAAGDPAAAGEAGELQAAAPTAASVHATTRPARLTTGWRYFTEVAGDGTGGYFMKEF